MRNVTLLILALVVSGCGGRSEPKQSLRNDGSQFLAVFNQAVAEADALDVYTVDPDQDDKSQEGQVTFNIKQLGHLSASAEQRQAMTKAIADNVFTMYGSYGCFEPRHVFVLHSRSRVMRLLICFQCNTIIGSDYEDNPISVHLHGDEAALVVNGILDAASIPRLAQP